MSKPGQTILVALRKMIASGELAAGERLMEVPTAELFGVSRMPVRMAFRTLEQEGLLVPFGGRGFQVRSI
ncbi:transcriptional regulator VanR, partial [Pseudomonas syringae pv. actinidiae ICMP 18886]